VKVKKGVIGSKNNLLHDKISHSSRRGDRKERKKFNLNDVETLNGYVCVLVYTEERTRQRNMGWRFAKGERKRK